MPEQTTIALSGLRGATPPSATEQEFGADTLRLYIMFLGDFEKAAPWNPSAVKGCKRFLDRIWAMAENRIEGDESPYSSTLAIPGGELEMTTSKDVLEALSAGAGPRRVLVTLGYAGWGAGQLEDEIARNGWLTVDAEPSVIFDTPAESRYGRALSLLGIDVGMLMQDAGHA